MTTFNGVLLSCRFSFASLSQKYKHAIPSALSLSKKNYSTTTETAENYDIIITGGGMVGTTLACALANNRILESTKVLLLEGSGKHKYTPQEQYSNRVVALNQQTRTLLSSLGAWQHIEAVRYCPIRKMQVWDACSDAMITFNEDYLAEELAYIVENDLLIHALNKQLSKKNNVTVIYDSKVAEIKLPKTSTQDAVVQLQSGKQYISKLLIGADGTNSMVRKAMDVLCTNWQYNQLGIVATVKLSEPTNNVVAWQRFLPTGPIAMLPLTESFSSIVWCVTTEKAKELLKVSEEEFVDRINEAFWKFYPKNGTVESGMYALRQMLETLSLQTDVSRQLQPSVATIVEGSRAAFPLGFGHATNYVKPGTVLVGDAAHRIHPLAGQGVNLGFGDVIALTKILAEAIVNGSKLNDLNYLKEYETMRQRHNVPMMLAIDALHRLYQGTAAPIVLARSLVLQLTNAIPQMKKIMMEYSAGKTFVNKY